MSDQFSKAGKAVARPDRANKRMLAGHFDKDVYRQFKAIAAEEGQPTETLLLQAIALLFDHYGKKQPESVEYRLKPKGLRTPGL